jgi:hypothetical protein
MYDRESDAWVRPPRPAPRARRSDRDAAQRPRRAAGADHRLRVRAGADARALGHRGYADLGRWLAANDAQIAGPVRELFLQVPEPDGGVEPVVEVQFPITPRT